MFFCLLLCFLGAFPCLCLCLCVCVSCCVFVLACLRLCFLVCFVLSNDSKKMFFLKLSNGLKWFQKNKTNSNSRKRRDPFFGETSLNFVLKSNFSRDSQWVSIGEQN